MTKSKVKSIIEKTLSQKLEKKTGTQVVYGETFGQINIDSPAYLTFDVTPTPINGTGPNGRVGNQIDLTGMHIDYQITQQNINSTAAAKFKFMVVKFRACDSDVFTTGNANNPLETMMDYNQFIRTAGGGSAGIIDYSSARNKDHFGNYQVVRTGHASLPPVQYAGSVNRVITSQLNIKWKTPLLLQYDSSSGDTINERLMLVILASSGNMGTLSTLQGVPTLLPFSGYDFSYESVVYYTDA